MKSNIEDMIRKSVNIDEQIEAAYAKGLNENLDRKNRLLIRCLASINTVGAEDWSELIADIENEVKGK